MRKILVLFAFLIIPSFGWSSEDPNQSEELSLKQDREQLDELRKDIPPEVKSENDDLAFILKLFEDKSRDPGKIRRQFDKVYNKRRKDQQNQFKKERDQFTAKEKSERKNFIAEAKTKREKFLEGKPAKDAKKEFFEQERTDRDAFFSGDKERRKDFESDIRARQKDFDDFLKSKRKEFDDKLQEFKKEQKDMKEMEKKSKMQSAHPKSAAIESELSPQNQKYLEDFKNIPKSEGNKLAPEKEQ